MIGSASVPTSKTKRIRLKLGLFARAIRSSDCTPALRSREIFQPPHEPSETSVDCASFAPLDIHVDGRFSDMSDRLDYYRRGRRGLRLRAVANLRLVTSYMGRHSLYGKTLAAGWRRRAPKMAERVGMRSLALPVARHPITEANAAAND